MPCLPSQVHLVSLGITSLIQTYLYAVVIDFMCNHVRLILHELGISLPHEDSFSKVRNAYMKSAYYSICDDYRVDANKTNVWGLILYNRLCYFWSWGEGNKKGYWKNKQISEGICLFSSRPSIVVNSAPAADAQKVFKGR